jgi:hypothetical protein
METVSDPVASGKQWYAVLRGTEKVSSVEGGRAETVETGVKIIPDKGIGTVRVVL